MSVAAQDTLTGAGVQTVTGAKTFNDQTLLLKNPAGTFSLTAQAPAITANRNTTASLLPYHWDTLVWKDTTNSRTFAFDKTGTILASGTAGSASDDTVINAAITNCPANGTVLIMPGSYTEGLNVTTHNLTSDITIMGYGVTLTYGTSHTGGIWFKVSTGVRAQFYGIKFDINKFCVAAIGGSQGSGTPTTGSDMPKLLRVVDCRITNQLNMGLSNGGNKDPSAYPNDTEIDIRNCVFDAGGVNSITNECVYINNARWISLQNTRLENYRQFYLTGEHVFVNNVWASAANYQTFGQYNAINAAQATVQHLTITDSGLSIRPAGAANGAVQEKWANCDNCTIKNYVHRESTATHSGALEIKGFDDTYILNNVTISDMYSVYGGVKLTPYPGSLHSKVRNLRLENINLQIFDANGGWLLNEYHDIDSLTMNNLYCNGSPGNSVEAPLRVLLNSSNMVIGKVLVENFYPEMTGSNIIVVRQDTAGTPPARTLTVNFIKPILRNRQAVSNTYPSTVTMKFFQNAGRYITNGNASTKAFNIPHSLVSSPAANSIRVNAGHADSRGTFDVTADATNIIVTYPSAPPTGTNNVVLYWAAEAG